MQPQFQSVAHQVNPAVPLLDTQSSQQTSQYLSIREAPTDQVAISVNQVAQPISPHDVETILPERKRVINCYGRVCLLWYGALSISSLALSILLLTKQNSIPKWQPILGVCLAPMVLTKELIEYKWRHERLTNKWKNFGLNLSNSVLGLATVPTGNVLSITYGIMLAVRGVIPYNKMIPLWTVIMAVGKVFCRGTTV